MTGELHAARYASRYPREGQLAILCEGDVVGYEVDLLEKWTASEVRDPLVDVWPCGTKTAIFGMSDAIGRSVRMIVIEDRDFRTVAEAQQECTASLKDRQERAVQVKEWRTWERHEIENYLIEPAVLIPVLASAFLTTEDDVRERLSHVIACLRVDQAAQWALSRFASTLPDTPRYIGGLPRKTARPRWDSSQRKFVVPPIAEVENSFQRVVEEKARKLQRDCAAVDSVRIIELFKQRCADWGTVDVQDDAWKIDWGGKEILATLCRWLSGEFGWPATSVAERERLDWGTLADRREDAAKDREIAATLQPRFVDAFLRYLQDASADRSIAAEWRGVVDAVRGA